MPRQTDWSPNLRSSRKTLLANTEASYWHSSGNKTKQNRRASSISILSPVSLLMPESLIFLLFLFSLVTEPHRYTLFVWSIQFWQAPCNNNLESGPLFSSCFERSWDSKEKDGSAIKGNLVCPGILKSPQAQTGWPITSTYFYCGAIGPSNIEAPPATLSNCWTQSDAVQPGSPPWAQVG